jgi:peptidyl-prolyl cis-trans isomerase B (cyclophilin B)
MLRFTNQSVKLSSRLSSFFFLGVLFILTGCVRDPRGAELGCQSSRIPCFSETANVSLETSRGAIVVKVDGANAPLTAGNFLDLVRKGVYNQTIFHRVVKSPLPFVVQGGDPNSSDPKTPASAYGSGQYIDSATGAARYIPLEFRVKSSKILSYGKEVASLNPSLQPVLTHDRGAVAMARSSDPNSASAQFYIALEALPELDGRYAVFGRVVRGMDVVDQLEQGDKLIRATLLKN